MGKRFNSELSKEENDQAVMTQNQKRREIKLVFLVKKNKTQNQKKRGKKVVFFPKRVLVYPLLGSLKNKTQNQKKRAKRVLYPLLGTLKNKNKTQNQKKRGEKWVFFPKRVLVYPLLGTLKNKKKKNKTAASADSSATDSDQLALEHPPLDAASSALSALNALNSGDPNWVDFFNPAQEFDWGDFFARYGQDGGYACFHPPGLKLRFYKWGL